MMLNPDCVRDVLLAVEACPFSETLNVEKLSVKLPDYSEDDLWYTCLKLDEGGYLTLITMDIMRSYRPGIKCIVDLTYRGHEFLNSVRDDDRWKKAKKAGSLIRDYSLSAIASIAEGITAAAIPVIISKLSGD